MMRPGLVFIHASVAVLCLSLTGILSASQDKPAKKDAEKKSATAQTKSGQDKPAAASSGTAPKTAAAKQPDARAIQAQYEEKLTAWKDSLKHLRQLRQDYQVADADGRGKIEQQWDEGVKAAQQRLAELRPLAVSAYVAAPNDDRYLARFLVKLLADDVARDQYEQAVPLADALISHQCELPEVYRAAGSANFALQNFDVAAALIEKAGAAGVPTGDLEMLRKQVTEYQKLWKQEQEIRAQEVKADDLPRVKLTTTKGEIELELFENEAPETVGNFISLVKKGFYDGLTFHRVLAGFMAQGGCPEGDGTGGPGYTIYDEFDKPNARKHFRGSLSMAKTLAPNSGGSQFFLTFRPTPELNGKHTVFGRVIKGMDVVMALQRRDPDKKDAELPEPDTIIKAEVLRDRGHDYLPHKVE